MTIEVIFWAAMAVAVSCGVGLVRILLSPDQPVRESPLRYILDAARAAMDAIPDDTTPEVPLPRATTQRDYWARQFRLSVWWPCAGELALLPWIARAQNEAGLAHLQPGQYQDATGTFTRICAGDEK